MNKVVLVVGRHKNMMAKVLSLLIKNGYEPIGALTDDEALQIAQSFKIDAIIFGGGVEMRSREFLKKEMAKINPVIGMIDAHPQTVLHDLEKYFNS